MPTHDPAQHPSFRYLVLRHDAIPEPHFDLMFEPDSDSPLLTWRSPRWPLQSGDYVQEMPEHRRIYLDYQGPVSNGRGYVTRVHAGRYRSDAKDSARFEATLEDGSALILRRDNSDQWIVIVRKEKK